MVDSKLDREKFYDSPRSKILDSIDMSKRKSKLLDFLFWTGLVATVGVCYVGYRVSSYMDSERHNNLPQEVKKYDINQDGRLNNEEVNNLIRDYELKR